MNIKTLAVTACALLCSCAFQLSAQSHPAKPKVGELILQSDDSIGAKKVYKVLIENAPKGFNIPNAPRFYIRGKEDKFYLGIGGYVKGSVSYDFGDPIESPINFVTSSINMAPTPGNNGLLQMSAATSTLSFNFVALPGTDNSIGAYVSFDFTGDNYTPSLSQAYLTYRGLKTGYAHSAFNDAAACPPTIDNEGPNAYTGITNGVVDYEKGFAKNWKVGVGLELPMASITTDKDTYSVNQRYPDIPVYLQYAWGGGASWLRFSAIMRNMTYRDVASEKNRTVTGWGVKASGSASFGPFVSYYQAAYGKGITSYFQDLTGLGLDLVPKAGKEGELDAVKAWGGYLGLQYNFSANCFASATYSHLRCYPDKYSAAVVPATSWDAQYSYAQYVVANVFYNITPSLQWGIEYIYGRRVDMNHGQQHDNRIQTSLQLSF